MIQEVKPALPEGAFAWAQATFGLDPATGLPYGVARDGERYVSAPVPGHVLAKHYKRLHHELTALLSVDPAGAMPAAHRALEGIYALGLRAERSK